MTELHSIVDYAWRKQPLSVGDRAIARTSRGRLFAGDVKAGPKLYKGENFVRWNIGGRWVSCISICSVIDRPKRQLP